MSTTMEKPVQDFIPQGTLGCWSVFNNVMARREREREARYRFEERLAILLDDKDALPSDEQMELAVQEMREMEWKMKVWWL